MLLKWRTIHTVLCTGLALAACGDSKGSEADGSTTAELTTTTTPSGTDTGTTPTDPTGETSASDPTTDGTTGPEPTTGDPFDQDVYDQCKANDVDAAALIEAQCMCLVMDGLFVDQAECLAEVGMPAGQSDCTCTLYAKHPELKPVLDCNGPPQKVFAGCFSQAGCEDPEAQSACFDAYFEAVAECPEPPPEFNNENEIACLGAEAFMCGSGEQVPSYVVCDFQDDCADASDEMQMCPPAFMCTDGTKVPASYKCDGEPDCRDMSDEAGCPTFMCMDGQQIPEVFKCNQEPDCMDGSDEVGCPTFMCMDGEQIPLPYQCDGFPDCMDASDEVDCPTFMCTSGEEVPLTWKCDGVPDCMDMSDEANCP